VPSCRDHLAHHPCVGLLERRKAINPATHQPAPDTSQRALQPSDIIESVLATPSNAVSAICRSKILGPVMDWVAANCMTRRLNPEPGIQTRAPADSSAARNPDASSKGRRSRRRRMGDHAPELEYHRQTETPPVRSTCCGRNCRSCGVTLRHRRAVGIHQQICVERDHQIRRTQSLIAARSDRSRLGARSPSTITHRTGTLRRRLLPPAPPSSRRRPRSTNSRKVDRVSAARFFAATNRSSGDSIVVFIWVYIMPSLWVVVPIARSGRSPVYAGPVALDTAVFI